MLVKNSYRWIWRGSLLWGLEMVLLHVDIRDYVVVLKGVLARSEIPRLSFRVVLSLLESFKFIVEVNNVVSLFISESVVSILSKHINHVLLLSLLNCLLCLFVIVNLSNRIVQEVLLLNELSGDFAVRLRDALEVSFLINVVRNVLLPFVIP
jgi:hypothetical protein